MSDFSFNTKSLQSSNSSVSLPDILKNLSALGAGIQAQAEALRASCESGSNPPVLQTENKNTPNGAVSSEKSENTRKPEGETRCYWFSPAAVRHERDLLQKYRAKDFRALLEEMNTLLVGLVKTMKSVHPDARLKGYVVSSLGCLLEQASILALRMRNVYNEVELTPEKTKPGQS